MTDNRNRLQLFDAERERMYQVAVQQMRVQRAERKPPLFWLNTATGEYGWLTLPPKDTDLAF